ncbi:hypothetical protein CPB84DRAFT_1749997 [Gymnopilus junonius]|uniref:Nephrocystin 3-like N-terminal domain-containing protein n=1 Tax=Gymnopilus junonius TaxID=109634 RepID=A0A9P5NG53_GYMJU|nr:hypothetical protein CPB84DRAFT_1749997 [Gymnopilus junonius]
MSAFPKAGPLTSVGTPATDGGDIYNGDQLHHGIFGGKNNVNVVNNNTTTGGGPGSSGFGDLYKHIAVNALHNSDEVSDQPKCHPGTREAVLDQLFTWAGIQLSPYLIQWLHGPAGAGKSSILRTIAQKLFENNLLLGSFFFFRTSERRNSSEYVITTIAYQLALSIPKTRQHIGKAVERNPAIFSLSLWEQALALIVSPIVSIFYDPTFDSRQYPRVIVIDGLDECDNPAKQCQLIHVLHQVIQSVPIPLSLLVASRPEHHIRGAFDDDDLKKCSFRLALDNSLNPDADIRTYLEAKFAVIRQSRPMEFSPDTIWPIPDDTDTLIARASGQFIYASTVEKFVSSPRHNPVKRLEIILGANSEGSQKPFEELDNLYSTIFRTVVKDHLTSTLRVLGFLLIPGLEFPKHPNDFEKSSPAYIEKFFS